MYKLKFLTISIILVMVFSLAGPSFTVAARPLAAASDPGLGAAASFSVLAQTQITNVPTSVISGDVGLNTVGTNYAGLTTSEVAGTIYATNMTGPTEAILPPAVQADALAAFTTNIPGQPLTSNQGPALDGLTLVSGVYDIGAGRLNGGVLILDGPGIYIFRASSDFISSGSISFINGADPCNLYWRVDTLATINGSSFAGTILAGTGVHFGANVTLNGQALAIGGDVTMISDTITGPICATTTATTLSASSATTGSGVYDNATVTGVNGSTAGGTVTYTAYTNSTCTSGARSAGTVAVINGFGLPSSPLTFSTPGTYYWQAAYSGDANNAASTSVCGTEVLTVVAATPPVVLPATGFAPNQMTVLPAQPADQAYTAMGDLWLEIPKLGVKMNIVGVPPANGKWDVSWLGSDAGWLQGSAFPTWAGNSVLTGHVWNADNSAGPFRYINTLWWGDKVIVHAWGAQYVYQVRSVMQVGPGNTNAMMKHEELPWVTLLTCRGFDQASGSYKYRVLVRAVLMDVK